LALGRVTAAAAYAPAVQTLAEIRELLASRGLSPRKALGQNFLIDQNLIRKLVDASGIKPGDLVLEVGPGTGALTEALLARGARVVAAELDRGLAELLRERLADPQSALGAPAGAGFTLVEGDCLASKRHLAPALAAALGGRPFTLVANLPYGAATPLMLALLAEHPECPGQFVTIQKEVADRLLAKPGTNEYGTLGVVAQAVARVERIATLPPECFWPRPEVTSAMVSVVRRPDPLTANTAGLATFAQELFSRRRKQLGSVLGRDLSWPDGVKPENRVEQLPPDRVVALGVAAGRL
jgi:16S rRNA (adenine1518-N6/adenine1519-N6)-dimethyltransferase